MAKGNKKQRKRVAKTLSKAFRKLEVGHQQPQPIPAPRENPSAKSEQRTGRLRKRQEQTKASTKHTKGNLLERAEFDREQASLHERCWKKNGSQIKKNQSTRVIELLPPIFSITPHEVTIERGIAALDGIGSTSKFMSNGLGEASSCFLLQQAQKKDVNHAPSKEQQNRFAALLDNDIDPLQGDQSTPTPLVASQTSIFRFPPPLLQVPRARMRDMPEAPLISSLDSLDV